MPKLDVEELLMSWVNAAGAIDEFVLVSDLLESEEARVLGEGMELGRARAAVLAERPALAAGLLADVDRSVLTSGDLTWRGVIAMAAWAAQGDVEALEALVRVGQKVDESHAASHRYVLATAAEQAGQLALADASWKELSEKSNLTSTLLQRTIVADLVARSTTDPVLASEALVKAAYEVINLDPMPEDSLRPTLDVVARLEARGDRAGAWLLLEAISRMRPVARGLIPLREERSAGGGWWYERLPGLVAMVAAAVFGSVVMVTGVAGGFAFVGAVVAILVFRRWRLPQGKGLAGVDPAVLAGARTLLPDVPNPIAQPIRVAAAYFVGGIFGGSLATLVATLFTELLLIDLYDANTATADAIIWPFVLLCTAMGGVVTSSLLPRLQLSDARKLVDRLRAGQLVPAGRCVCVSSRHMSGLRAEKYVADHLGAPEPDIAAAVPVIPHATVAAYQCPLSKTPWLEVRRAEDELLLLLRGDLAYVSDESEAVPGGYL